MFYTRRHFLASCPVSGVHYTPQQTSLKRYRNPNISDDVDGDGTVSPLDVLTLVNAINGQREMPLSKYTPGKAPFLDVNGDGGMSPLDILTVINAINSGKYSGSNKSAEK